MPGRTHTHNLQPLVVDSPAVNMKLVSQAVINLKILLIIDFCININIYSVKSNICYCSQTCQNWTFEKINALYTYIYINWKSVVNIYTFDIETRWSIMYKFTNKSTIWLYNICCYICAKSLYIYYTPWLFDCFVVFLILVIK